MSSSVCSSGFQFTGLLPVALNLLDIGLTIVGLIPAPVPVAGQVAIASDASTIALNLMINEPVGVVLSAISVIPLVGEFAGVIKILYKVAAIMTFFLGSPLIQVGLAIAIVGFILLVYYFIYYIE